MINAYHFDYLRHISLEPPPLKPPKLDKNCRHCSTERFPSASDRELELPMQCVQVVSDEKAKMHDKQTREMMHNYGRKWQECRELREMSSNGTPRPEILP